MARTSKVCPVVVRLFDGRHEVLAFMHPVAGKQFVKGTVESDEQPLDAARRELREESGLNSPETLIFLGIRNIGEKLQPWHFFEWRSTGLPNAWAHQTEDDHGHVFSFFWHP